jgi:WD40 repeat protein
VSADRSGVLVFWKLQDAENREVLVFKPFGAASPAICDIELCKEPSKDGLVAVGYQNGAIYLFDVLSGTTVNVFYSHELEIQSLSWSFTGNMIASSGKDKRIVICDSSSGKVIKEVNCITGGGDLDRRRSWVSLTWSSCFSDELYFSNNIGALYKIDVLKEEKPKKLKSNLHSRPIFCTIHSSLTNRICTISLDRNIGIWNLADESLSYSLPTLGGFIYGIDCSNSSQLAIACGDNCIRISKNLVDKSKSYGFYDIKCLWKGINGKVTCLAWHPNSKLYGHILAFGTENGKACVYDTRKERLIQSFTIREGDISPTKSIGWLIRPESVIKEIVYACTEDGHASFDFLSWDPDKESESLDVFDIFKSKKGNMDYRIDHLVASSSGDYIAFLAKSKGFSEIFVSRTANIQPKKTQDIESIEIHSEIELISWIPTHTNLLYIHNRGIVKCFQSVSSEECIELKLFDADINTKEGNEKLVCAKWLNSECLICEGFSNGIVKASSFKVNHVDSMVEMNLRSSLKLGRHSSVVLSVHCFEESSGHVRILSGGEDQKLSSWTLEDHKEAESELCTAQASDDTPEEFLIIRDTIKPKKSSKGKKKQKSKQSEKAASKENIVISDDLQCIGLIDDPEFDICEPLNYILTFFKNIVYANDHLVLAEMSLIEGDADSFLKTYISKGLNSWNDLNLIQNLLRLAVSPLYGFESWNDECISFAKYLDKQKMHREAAYFHMISGSYSDACFSYIEAGLFFQAVITSLRINKEPNTLLFESLDRWSISLESTAQYILSACCLIAAHKYSEAVELLIRANEIANQSLKLRSLYISLASSISIHYPDSLSTELKDSIKSLHDILKFSE